MAVTLGVDQVKALAGRRFLVPAEYIGHGGTRAYFKVLMDFYWRHGAHVVAVTSYASEDQPMQDFMKQKGFTLLTFPEFTKQYLGAPSERPAVWSRRGYLREVTAFSRLFGDMSATDVTISVGTSGMFLSAVQAGDRPLLISHGYPHGARQRLAGARVMGARLGHGCSMVTVSQFSADLFQRQWHLDVRGVGVTAIRTSCGPTTIPWPLERRERRVITAALVQDYKRPLDWLEIADRVNRHQAPLSTEFVWFGDGPLHQEASDLAQRQAGRVAFPGWSEHVELHYRAARVYLQTSATESLGLSVVNALRFGLPAVVTDAGGLPEVVVDGVNGFVVPVGDTAAAAEAVLRLLSDDSLWQKYSQAGLELYEARFSQEQWDRDMLQAHAVEAT